MSLKAEKHLRRNNSTHNSHDTVQVDGNTVASTTVSGREDFGRIRVQSAVVDVLHQTRNMSDKQCVMNAKEGTYQAEADAAGECQILSIVADLSVGEEESHGEEGSDDLYAMSARLIRILNCI